RKTIRELFKKEFELAKFAKGRVALAETLLSRAAELQDDKTGLYALLAEAAEIAAAAGDLPLALKAVAEVDQYFGTPAFELKEKVGKILIPLAKSPEQILHVIELELTIFREALSQDEIELAERSLQVAQTLSRKPGMAILKDQMNVVTKEFSSIKAAFQTVDDARQTLRTKPDDRTANLAWGKYLCFIKGDWTNGLPFLMKSQSAPLAALAKRDLERPTDPDANVLLGDEWCTIGELEKEPARTNICLHATEAYNRGLPGLTGLNLSLTEGKLSRLFGDSEIFASNGDPQGTLLADAALNFSSAGTVECWVQTRVTEGVLFSKRGVEPEGSLGIRLYQGQACLMENASYHYRESRTELTINDGNWHHVAIVKAGKNAAFFFDGKLVATLQVRDQLISKSPWKLGTCCGHAPIAVKACKFRISNTARYFVSFKPEYNYKKDKATVFISDPK
ncbi:MAG: LamG-like jellyroll fold domain-containing protein, partial [Planctomycetota bacterium]